VQVPVEKKKELDIKTNDCTLSVQFEYAVWSPLSLRSSPAYVQLEIGVEVALLVSDFDELFASTANGRALDDRVQDGLQGLSEVIDHQSRSPVQRELQLPDQILLSQAHNLQVAISSSLLVPDPRNSLQLRVNQ